jgi:uncharacterized protein (DUF1810 family)
LSVERFLAPQDNTHAQALAEIKAGRKVTHWIWWEMPQLARLGHSPRAVEFGLAGLEEASDYLAHPVLKARLLELCTAMLSHAGKSAEDLLGPVDAMKVRSMATLFSRVPGAPDVFEDILETFYNGARCPVSDAATETGGCARPVR